MDRNEYLEIVMEQIRCKRAVPYLKGELEDHIQDQKDAFIADGMIPEEAEMMAVREMGDGWTVKTADGKLSAHYENTVLIGDNGVEILTL